MPRALQSLTWINSQRLKPLEQWWWRWISKRPLNTYRIVSTLGRVFRPDCEQTKTAPSRLLILYSCSAATKILPPHFLGRVQAGRSGANIWERWMGVSSSRHQLIVYNRFFYHNIYISPIRRVARISQLWLFSMLVVSFHWCKYYIINK